MIHYPKEADLFDLIHEALNAPRSGFVGEAIYAAMWKVEMMGEDSEGVKPIQYVLSGLPFPIEQRHATVLASLVCWLGTNCGQFFLTDADRMDDEMPSIKRYERFLICWARQNSRRAFINGNIRTLEGVLTPYANNTPVALTASDFEVAEYLMLWFGTHEGEQFLTNCKISFDEAIEQDRKRRLAVFKNQIEMTAQP